VNLSITDIFGCLESGFQSNGTNLVIQPASRVPAHLKDRLPERKAEILRQLEPETRRANLGISMAIDNGTSPALLIFGESDAMAVKDMARIYKPLEVHLTAAQRRELAKDVDYYERLARRRQEQ
jgi:hypothetical protein